MDNYQELPYLLDYFGLIHEHRPPGHPDMSGQPREATRSYPDFTRSPGKLRVIVDLHKGGSNYGPRFH